MQNIMDCELRFAENRTELSARHSFNERDDADAAAAAAVCVCRPREGNIQPTTYPKLDLYITY